jgi:hypothetical protein
MSVTLYGVPDPDPTLLDAVIEWLGDRDAMILCHQRKPIDARPCQYPGLLRYEIVINGTAYAAYQERNGKIYLP